MEYAEKTGDMLENQPLISVALPVYNGEKHLAIAIESILAQTYVNFELIMVNDGSTDNSLGVLRGYAEIDSRVRIISRTNKGNPASLNEAIDNAKGRYIVRMDQDDICLPNRFQTQIEFMLRHPDAVAVGSAANFIDQNGESICTFFPECDDVQLRSKFPDSPFVHPSVMLAKEVFYQAGKYDERMKLGGEDVVLFERMSKFGRLYNLNTPLISYRLVPGSLSRKPAVFRNMLTRIIDDQIAGNFVADSRFEDLQQLARSIDKSKAVFDYHFEVAKLYIWSGGPRNKIFTHLRECVSLQGATFKVVLMYMLSMMPKLLVRKVYFFLKARCYDRA